LRSSVSKAGIYGGCDGGMDVFCLWFGRMVAAMSAEAIRGDWVGRVIDERFPLLKWLGGSASSGVFLTELMGPGSRKAAIKLVPAGSADAEARIVGWGATSGLDHPHLMRVFHTGRCEMDAIAMVYSVTEYAEELLSEIIPERPLTTGEVKEMLVPVLDALFYLHARGFVHGHLKPSNILVAGNVLKISGDGVEIAGERGRYYRVLSVYDAPEVPAGPMSPAVDVWSLGVTLVEALNQDAPAWDRWTRKEPVVPESVPLPYARMAQECLRWEPERRCTLSDVNKGRSEPVRTRESEAKQPAGGPPARLRVAAVVAGVVALLAVLAVLFLRPHHPAPPAVTQRAAPALKEKAAPAVRRRPEREPATAPTSAGSSAAAAQGTSAGVVKGTVTERVMPDVAASASATIQGTLRVRVRVAVGADGKISGATFDSAGPSKYFARLALQAAQGWRFTPAQVDGRSVGSVWMLEFDFRRDGTEVKPVEVSP